MSKISSGGPKLATVSIGSELSKRPRLCEDGSKPGVERSNTNKARSDLANDCTNIRNSNNSVSETGMRSSEHTQPVTGTGLSGLAAARSEGGNSNAAKPKRNMRTSSYVKLCIKVDKSRSVLPKTRSGKSGCPKLCIERKKSTKLLSRTEDLKPPLQTPNGNSGKAGWHKLLGRTGNPRCTESSTKTADDIWMRLCTSKVNPRCKKSSTEGNESRNVAAKAEIVKPTQLQDLNKMNKLIWHRSNREMLESIRASERGSINSSKAAMLKADKVKPDRTKLCTEVKEPS